MIYPITGDHIHSTGQINAMVISVGYFLLISSKKLLSIVSVLGLTTIALAYANRTGMVFSAIFALALIFQIFNSSRFKYSIITFIGILIFIFFVAQLEVFQNVLNIGINRLFDERLETERSDLLETGLEIIKSGQYPFGGAQLGAERAYPWYHNIYLDAYRVAGFPALLLFLLLTLMSAYAMLSTKSVTLFIIWSISFAMIFTSVPIEGAFLEYSAYFSIFFYALVVDRERKSHYSRQRKSYAKLHLPTT
jgi:hypothetical protein